MTRTPRHLFITGNSAGLGRALAQAYLGRGWRVYGCSRRGCDLTGDLRDAKCDLAHPDAIPPVLTSLLDGVPRLDLVILNAGVLGEIALLTQTPLAEIQRVMDVNVWANKVIMDWLHAWGRPIDQVVMISSGASVLGNKGWGAYALSKATLNMLARLYAHEFADTHISAIAPGLIDTSMMDYLCGDVDPQAFPALGRIRQARGTDAMPDPGAAAERIIGVLPELKAFESGSYVDIRQILVPDEYAQLMQARNRPR